jgi:hypothetical protein
MIRGRSSNWRGIRSSEGVEPGLAARLDDELIVIDTNCVRLVEKPQIAARTATDVEDAPLTNQFANVPSVRINRAEGVLPAASFTLAEIVGIRR